MLSKKIANFIPKFAIIAQNSEFNIKIEELGVCGNFNKKTRLNVHL
jgi:hypothetical protein